MDTPTLSQVLNDAIDNKLIEVHTMLPGKVVRVDHSIGICDVQPLLKSKSADEVVTSLPVIPNVTIAHYRAGTAYIFLPLKVGDLVELRFCERSLDLWKSKSAGEAVK